MRFSGVQASAVSMSLLTITPRQWRCEYRGSPTFARRPFGVLHSSGCGASLQLRGGTFTKTLLTVKAGVETLAGLAMLLFPGLAITLLFGVRLTDSAAMALGWMAGVALLTLGLACWMVRKETHGSAARGVVVAMLFYDAAIVAIFLLARVRGGLSGVCLWPAVGLHLGLGAWSFVRVAKGPNALAQD